MTYIPRPFTLTTSPRCDQCRNTLPTNERGYCQRCEEGWREWYKVHPAFRMLDDELDAEIGLVFCSITTAEVTHRIPWLLDLQKIQKSLLQTLDFRKRFAKITV